MCVLLVLFMFLSILIAVHSFIILFLFFSILIFDVLQGPHGKFWPPALYTLFTNIIQRRSSSPMTYASVVQTICTCLHCCSNNINHGSNSWIFRKLQLSVLLDFFDQVTEDNDTFDYIHFVYAISYMLPMGGLDNTICVELVSCFGCSRTFFMVIQYLFITVTLHPWTGLVINNNNRFAIIALRSAIGIPKGFACSCVLHWPANVCVAD